MGFGVWGLGFRVWGLGFRGSVRHYFVPTTKGTPLLVVGIPSCAPSLGCVDLTGGEGGWRCGGCGREGPNSRRLAGRFVVYFGNWGLGDFRASG